MSGAAGAVVRCCAGAAVVLRCWCAAGAADCGGAMMHAW